MAVDYSRLGGFDRPNYADVPVIVLSDHSEQNEKATYTKGHNKTSRLGVDLQVKYIIVRMD